MTDEIVLYTFPMSRGRIVHWMLEELGVPYRLEIVDVPKNETHKPEFLAINPMGKVPVLIHRGVVITETAACCVYLADTFREKGLAPALDDPRRGPYLRWMFFTNGGYEAAMFDKIAPRTNPPPVDAVGHGDPELFLDVMEQALQPGPYILGDTFSAADVYVASQISFSLLMGRVTDRPVFDDYAQRMEARPAHQRMADRCHALVAELGMPPITYPTS